jgi:hypothetical protein
MIGLIITYFSRRRLLECKPKRIKAMANSISEESSINSSHSSLDQSSTHTDSERKDAKISEDDEKMKLLAHQENRNVMKMQIVLVGSLALCAMVLGVITFLMDSGEEEDNFRDEVSGGSNKETFQLRKSQN